MYVNYIVFVDLLTQYGLMNEVNQEETALASSTIDSQPGKESLANPGSENDADQAKTDPNNKTIETETNNCVPVESCPAKQPACEESKKAQEDGTAESISTGKSYNSNDND